MIGYRGKRLPKLNSRELNQLRNEAKDNMSIDSTANTNVDISSMTFDEMITALKRMQALTTKRNDVTIIIKNGVVYGVPSEFLGPIFNPSFNTDGMKLTEVE